jgi:hypothetical protein
VIIQSFPGEGPSVRESIAVGTYVSTGFPCQLEDSLISLRLDAFHGLDLLSALLFGFCYPTFLQLRVEVLRLGGVPSEETNTNASDELLFKE